MTRMTPTDIGRLLSRLADAQGEPGDLESALRGIAEAALEYLSADLCVVFAVNPITEKFIWPPNLAGKLVGGQTTKLENPPLGGVACEILDSSVPLFVAELTLQPLYQSAFTSLERIISFAAIVLRTERDRKPLAVLYLDYREPYHFDDDYRDQLCLFAKQAARALQNTWFIRRYRDVLRISTEINLNLTSVDDLFERLHKHVAGILDTSSFLMLAVHHPETNTLDRYMVEEGIPKTIRALELSGAPKWIIENRRSQRIGDLSVERAGLPFELIPIDSTEQYKESLLFVPLLLHDTALGALSVQHPRPYTYDEEDQHLLELLGSHVALALSNLKLLENLRQLNQTGQTLIQKLDSKEVLNRVVDRILRSQRCRFGCVVSAH